MVDKAHRFSSMKQLTSFASRRMKHSNYAVRPKRSHGEFLTINVSPFLSSLRHNMGGLLVYAMPLSFVLFLMESKTLFFLLRFETVSSEMRRLVYIVWHHLTHLLDDVGECEELTFRLR